MAQEAVLKTAPQAPPARPWIRAPTRARSTWWREKRKCLLSWWILLLPPSSLSKLTVTDDRTKPVSSELARARTSAIATAAATAKATLGDSVKRGYVKLPVTGVARICVLPFPKSLNKCDGAQQLTRSVKSAMSDVLLHCDDRCTEGLRSPTRVPGWNHLLHKTFTRAITPDKPTSAHTTTLIDVFFFTGVMGHRRGCASKPEASTVLLRLLMTRFDRVDTGEGYTELHTFEVCNGMPSRDFSREFRVLVSTVTRTERVLAPGTDVVLEVVRVAVNEQFPTLRPSSYPGSKTTDPRPYVSLDAMWRA